MKYFFFIFTSLFLLVNCYVFYRIWQALPNNAQVRMLYITLYSAVCLSFLLAMLGRNVLPVGLLSCLYAIGTTWLIVMIYYLLFFLISDIVLLLNHFLHFIPTHYPSYFHPIRVGICSIVIFILLIFGYYRFNHPVVVERELQINKKAGNKKSLQVVLLSDIHLGLLIGKEKLRRYVDQVNDLNPDVILIAGDLIDNSVRVLNDQHMETELLRLKAPTGIYFSPGNHEYISGIQESMTFLQKTNMTILIDQSITVDESFVVIGRDDRFNPNRASLDNLMVDVDASLPIILVDHQPFQLDEAEKNGIDLFVSGHTHEGQFWPGNLIVKKIYELGYGYKQKGATHVCVTSGLGLWGPVFRIGTQSEIVLLQIKFND